MTAQWVKYDGSEKQLRQLLSTSNKFIVDSQWSIFSKPTTLKLPDTDDNLNWLAGLLRDTKVKAYLICDPHPYADMICQWAHTGQPVWGRSKDSGETGLCHENFPPFMNPAEFEYSFTPFEEEVWR